MQGDRDEGGDSSSSDRRQADARPTVDDDAGRVLNAVTAKTASEVEDFHQKIDESFQKYVACYDFPVEWVLSYLKVYAMREGLDIADRLHRFRSRRKTGILEELKTMDHEV